MKISMISFGWILIAATSAFTSCENSNFDTPNEDGKMVRYSVINPHAINAVPLGKGFKHLRIDPTEEALRNALEALNSIGGGTITFKVRDSFIDIEDEIDYVGDNITIDGEDRNNTFRYTGPDEFPSQIEGQDHLIRFFGDNNTVRNFTIYGFPEGVKAQSGNNFLFENLIFPIIGEDAITVNGNNQQAFNVVIRNCYFENAEDKAIMFNNGGSALIENCEWVNTTQPIRATGASGDYMVRNNLFRIDPSRPQHGRSPGNPRSDGPRFSGGNVSHTVIFENNVVRGSTRGIRAYNNVKAIIRNSTFDGCRIGVELYNNAKVRLEGNVITGATQNGISIVNTAQVDLGGGSVDINGDSTPSLGGNTIIGNTPWDVRSTSSNPVYARYNIWDHASAEEILLYDVTGNVIVE